MPPSPLCRPAIAELVRQAPLAQVAVETSSGPHVTPAAFTAAAGRLWFVSSRRTVKVRSLLHRPVAGMLLRDGDRAAVVGGAVEILSPWGPAEAASSIAAAPTVSMAM